MNETTLYLFNPDDFIYLKSIGLVEKAKQNEVIISIDKDLDCISICSDRDWAIIDYYSDIIYHTINKHKTDKNS